jgi:hypothetical protein
MAKKNSYFANEKPQAYKLPVLPELSYRKLNSD